MAFLKSVYVKKESITWFTANMRTTIKKELLLFLLLSQFLSKVSYVYIPCLVLAKNLGRSL